MTTKQENGDIITDSLAKYLDLSQRGYATAWTGNGLYCMRHTRLSILLDSVKPRDLCLCGRCTNADTHNRNRAIAQSAWNRLTHFQAEGVPDEAMRKAPINQMDAHNH